jgi:hypothetical protein
MDLRDKCPSQLSPKDFQGGLLEAEPDRQSDEASALAIAKELLRVRGKSLEFPDASPVSIESAAAGEVENPPVLSYVLWG